MEHQSPLAPTMTMELGGVERTFKLDFNALSKVEDATGKSFLSLRQFMARPKISDVTALAWGCLVYQSGEQPMSLEAFRDLIGYHNVDELFGKTLTLITDSFPKADAAAEAGDASPLEETAPAKPTRRGKISKA